MSTIVATDRPEPDEPGAASERLHKRLGVVAAVLLGLATVATAWGAYQANRWGGVMAAEFNESVRLSADAGKAYQEGDAIHAVDATAFSQWVTATSEGEFERADYLAESLFSQSLVTAVAAWQAMGPAAAPPSPFELDEYVVAQWAEGDRLEAESQAATDRALAANQNGDDYVLLGVLLASVLFIAGAASTIESLRIRSAFLAIGGTVFAGCVVMLAVYPVH